MKNTYPHTQVETPGRVKIVVGFFFSLAFLGSCMLNIGSRFGFHFAAHVAILAVDTVILGTANYLASLLFPFPDLKSAFLPLLPSFYSLLPSFLHSIYASTHTVLIILAYIGAARAVKTHRRGGFNRDLFSGTDRMITR